MKWIGNNLLGLLLLGMITAFFVDFQSFKSDIKANESSIKTQMDNQDSRITVLEIIMILQNPNLTEEQKSMLLKLYSSSIDSNNKIK